MFPQVLLSTSNVCGTIWSLHPHELQRRLESITSKVVQCCGVALLADVLAAEAGASSSGRKPAAIMAPIDIRFVDNTVQPLLLSAMSLCR